MLIESIIVRNAPLRVLRKLFGQRNSSLLRKSTKDTAKNFAFRLNKSIPPEVAEGILLIKKYPEPHSIQWEDVSKALAKHAEDVQQVILKSCMELQDADALMSFYKHVLNKGEKFSQINLVLLIKMLANCHVSKILKYEESLLELYKKSKELMFTSEIYQMIGVQVFSYIPHCYRDLLSLPLENINFNKTEVFVARAFDFDDISTAWNLMEKLNKNPDKIILQSFVNYCIRQALLNTFTVNLIHKFVEICQKRGYIINTDSIICLLQPLVCVLRSCQDKYVWSVMKCVINTQMECLNCNTVLKESRITEDEFQQLKEAIHKALLPEDIFLKTSHKELKMFKNFLRSCQPYDIVVDGLNFLYCGVLPKKRRMIPIMFEKYVRQKNLKILIIARKHFKISGFFKNLPNSQFFFTEDSSDDDIFIILAALHGGLGTGLLTSDFLGTHSAKLDPDMKVLFIKWQMTHQFVTDAKYGIVSPALHLGLPQCTESPETGGNSYKWHLSYQEEEQSQYSFRLKFDWVCLQATPENVF